MFDMESGTVDIPNTIAMFQAMRARARSKGLTDLYLMPYAVSPFWEDLDESIVTLFATPNAASSYFLDYQWDSSTGATESTLAGNKLDPFQTAFFGIELEGARAAPGPVSSYSNIYEAIPPNGSGRAIGSVALFDPANGTIQKYVLPQVPSSDLPAIRTLAYDLERKFWSGNSENPANANSDDGYDNYGIANYITERSVIGSFPFVSRFNTGAGDQFFIDGMVSNQRPWYGMGAQDILPTWQWWTKDLNGSNAHSGLLGADYDLTTAWNGGSSLKVSGQLGPGNPTELRLFKTRLAVPGTDERHWLSLTYKLGQSGPTNLYVGLIFEDNPAETEWIGADDCAPSPRGTQGWSQMVVDLRQYEGRTIATISLGFKAGSQMTAASSYSINIGEIAISNDTHDNRECGGSPTGFALELSEFAADGVPSSIAQLRLTWNFDPAVWYYDIFRRQTPHSTANMMWLGRVSGDCYYVQSMPRIGNEKETVVQLVAVAPHGRVKVSDDATLPFSWEASPSVEDFSLALGENSVSLSIGNSVTIPITIAQLNYFSGPVTLTAKGLPAGVRAVFSPNPATGTSAALTLTAASSFPPGSTNTSDVTVVGTSGSLTYSETLFVTTLDPNFNLSGAQAVLLNPGSSSTATITITPLYNFNGAVTLSASGLPGGVTASFNPPTLTLRSVSSAASTLTLTASSEFSGFGQVTITGKSGSITQTWSIYVVSDAFA